ncbi:MAG: hypothetical protein J6N49_02935 [Alphaproteobacteria bacterium]|nr:hypothetical protein [Alphaproteobacteria bacterium]
MLNLTKQCLSADSEVLILNSNSVFADNKKVILAKARISADSLICRDSRACGSRMIGKNIGSRMTGKNNSKDNNFSLMSLLPSAAMARVSAIFERSGNKSLRSW